MRWTIGKKLSLGFGVGIAVMAFLSVFTYSQLDVIRVMQDEGAQRAKDTELCSKSVGISAELYQVMRVLS